MAFHMFPKMVRTLHILKTGTDGKMDVLDAKSYARLKFKDVVISLVEHYR